MKEIISRLKPLMKDKKCVILDMDGTILDSMPMWSKLDVIYLGSLGFEPDNEFLDKVKIMTIKQAADYICERYNTEKSADMILSDLIEYAKNEYIYNIPLKPKAKELIEYFHDNDFKIVIATSNELELTKVALKRTRVYQYVDGIMTSELAGKNKNFPDIYYKAAQLVNCTKEESIVFEDAMFAVNTAFSEGFTVVACYDEVEKNNWNTICSISNEQVVL